MARLPNVVKSSIGVMLISGTICSGELVLGQPNPTANEINTVYVRESTSAVEKLSLAERMERLKEWDKSATIYQEVITKYADRVVPIKTDDKGKATQYSSVALLVQEKLSKWPEEGIKAYRNRYEDSADEQLKTAGDNRQLLNNILWNYFPTESAKTAGIKLIASSFEQGEFASAAWVGKRLLDLHPTLITERPMILFQTAIAEQLCGDKANAQKRLVELKSRFGTNTGVIRGSDVVLADELDKLLRDDQPLTRISRSDTWPMQFGSADASAVPSQISAGGARLFSTEITPLVGRNVPALVNQRQKQKSNEEIKLGNCTGIYPVVDRQELFFQDNARIYAINLASGLPLTGWLQTYPGDKKGIFSIDAPTTPRGMQMGITVTDQNVIAILGQKNLYSPIYGYTDDTTKKPQLVCLDRNTGRKVWTTDPSKLQLPAELGNLKEASLSGCPLVMDGNIYVLLKLNKGGQFEECHLVSIRQTDGAFQWATYIASVASGYVYDDEMLMTSNSASATLAYSDGRLYVQSNLGVMACLDATEGKPIWVNLYPRQNSGISSFIPGGRINRVSGTGGNRSKPYTINPPMIAGGRLFALPADSTDLLIYDAATGEEVRRIARVIDNRNNSEPIEMLVGQVKDQLILANSSTVFVMPWQTFDPKKTLLENNCRFRSFKASGSNDRDESGAIRGRPLVTQTHILIPIATQLHRITLDNSFKIDSTYPAKGVWDEAEEAPGNVIATQDHLIVAGARHVMAYADLGLVTAKLDQKIIDNPRDVSSYIRYAELYLVAGRQVEAIDWLDKAIGILGGKNSISRGKDKDRFFELVLAYATKLQKNNAANPEIIRALFERARLSADSAEQKVRYELSHAAYMTRDNNPSGALDLYQQILSDPTQRIVSIAGKTAANAASEAEDAIIELLKKDQKIYDKYESQAALQYSSLAAAPNATAEEFLALANQFPIDKTGADSLKKAATLFESAGKPHEAIHVLRRLLGKAHSNRDKAQTLETLARLYSTIPGQMDLAILRLKQAGELNPNPVLSQPLQVGQSTIPSGEPIASALVQFKTYRNQMLGNSLATFRIPTNGNPTFKPTESLDHIAGILKQSQPRIRNDRVVVVKPDNSVTQIEAGTLKELHTPVKLADRPIGCVYFDDTLLVTSQTQVIAILPDGKEAWQMQLGKLPAIESTEESDSASSNDASSNQEIENPETQIRIQMLQQRRQLRLAGVNINNINGQVQVAGVNGLLQQQVFDPVDNVDGGAEQIQSFKLLNDRLVIATNEGRIVCIDLIHGNLLWQNQPADHALTHFVAIDDFVAVSITDPSTGLTEVAVLDCMNGKIARRIPAQQNIPNLANLAISSDGVLVMLYGNMIQSLDLFAINAPANKMILPNTGEAPFAQTIGTEQLIITDDRLLAVYNNNNNSSQSIRAYDLRTLKPIRVSNPNGQGADVSYLSGANNDNQNGMGASFLSIRAVGPIFYVVGQRSLIAHNLNHLDKDKEWVATGLDSLERGPVRDLIITQDEALIIQQSSIPAAPNATKMPKIHLSACSRMVVNGNESGLLELRTPITDPAGILIGQWQVTHDAFYYVTDDKKLKLMKTNP